MYNCLTFKTFSAAEQTNTVECYILVIHFLGVRVIVQKVIRNNLSLLTMLIPEMIVLTNEQVRNLGEGSNTCLDSPARKADLHKPAGLYPCHRQGGNQVQINVWRPYSHIVADMFQAASAIYLFCQFVPMSVRVCIPHTATKNRHSFSTFILFCLFYSREFHSYLRTNHFSNVKRSIEGI